MQPSKLVKIEISLFLKRYRSMPTGGRDMGEEGVREGGGGGRGGELSYRS